MVWGGELQYHDFLAGYDGDVGCWLTGPRHAYPPGLSECSYRPDCQRYRDQLRYHRRHYRHQPGGLQSGHQFLDHDLPPAEDWNSARRNYSPANISYAVFRMSNIDHCDGYCATHP